MQGDRRRRATQLKVTHIRSIAEQRPAARLRRRKCQLSKCGREELHPARRHALDHLPDSRVTRLGKEVDVGRSPELVEKRQLEEPFEPPGRVRNLIELLDHIGRTQPLPHVKSGPDELVAVGEVPVEAAFSRAKLFGERFDRHGRDSAAGDRVQRGQGPIVASQSHLPYPSVRTTIRYRMDHPTSRRVFACLAALRPSPRTTSLVLAALAGTHVYWAAGGVWPAANRETLAENVVGPGARFPPDLALYGVAAVLAAGSLVVTGAAHKWRSPVPLEVYAAAAHVGAGILAVRGVVGLASSLVAGLDAPYRRWDVALYSPLCLLLAAGVWHAGSPATA